MVEHGGKSSVAVNAAKKILNAYFHGKGLTDIPKTNKDGTVGVPVSAENSEESKERASEISASEEE